MCQRALKQFLILESIAENRFGSFDAPIYLIVCDWSSDSYLPYQFCDPVKGITNCLHGFELLIRNTDSKIVLESRYDL